MAYYSKNGSPHQISTFEICSPTHYPDGDLTVKRISLTIAAALIVGLFSPINAAQAAGTIWINPSTSLTTSFGRQLDPYGNQLNATGLKSNSDGTRLVSVKTGGQIVTSSDSGFTWQATSLNAVASGMCLSSDGSTIFVNENNGVNRKLHKSVDFGLNWTSTTFSRGAQSISCSDNAQKIIMDLGDYGRTYQVSTDSGSTWTSYSESLNNITTFQQLDFYATGFQYSPDGNLLIAKGDERNRVSGEQTQALLVSENNGQTWRNANLPLVFYQAYEGSQVLLAANGKIIFAAEDKVIRFGPLTIVSSTDKGQTWQTVTSAPGRPSVIQSSYDGGTLYAVNSGVNYGPAGTFKSTNFGQTWSLVAPATQVDNENARLSPNYLTLSGDGKALSVTTRNKFYTFNTNSAYLVSSDPSFTITINGQNVADGGTVNLPASTSSVEITTITSQPTSIVSYGEDFWEPGNFNYRDPDDCPAAGTCKIQMPIQTYTRNISGVETFRIKVTAPDQITTVTKTITVNQPFTKRIILDYNQDNRYWLDAAARHQEGLPGSGAGLPITFNINGLHFVAWSDGNTQNPRTDSFVKDIFVKPLWGVNAQAGKLYIDYLAQQWGRVTLDNPSGVDTFSGNCENSDGVCQQILPGASGSSVTAVPNEGSRFVRWSDGSTANPRRDLNVAASFSVTAVFSSPAAVITAGIVANSQVATFTADVKTAEIPATAALPAIKLSFGGSAPTAVTVAPVANPAAPTSTPFKILGSTKVVDITPTGTFTGSATVCLDGGPTDSIFHFTGGQWVELPSRSYANGQVCGVTTSFSPFAAAEPAPVNSAPSAPASAVATATGKRTATVAFTAPSSNGGSVVTSYTATSTPGGVTKTLTQAVGGTFNFDGLQPGTSYTFAVTAKNAHGTSAAATSNSIKTSAPDVASLTSVSFTDDGSGTGGKLAWVGSKIDAVLYAGPSSTYPGAFNFGAFSSSWNGSIRNLNPDTSYTISIYAISADGIGESKSLTFKTGAKNEAVKDLAHWSTWLASNTYVNGEAARLYGLMSKFSSLETSAYRSFIKVPISRASTVTATSLTPASCSVVSTTARVDAGMVKAITKEICTISYTVSGPSKAPATMVKDFVFKKVG